MRRFILFITALAFICSSYTLAWGQQTRFQQLLALQTQAKSYAQQSPYARDLLLYISATLLWAHMAKVPVYQFKMALTQELSQISPSSRHSFTEHSFQHMFAKRAKPVADEAQLSLFPEETPAPKPTTPKKEDLSWLDEAPEALAPTKKPQGESLFPELEKAAPVKKSYLSRRIEERYGHTNYFHKLSQEEIEGLFQRLNQAAAINYKSGKAAAHKFLSDMANKYPKAQVLFLQAKHLLLGGVLLIIADQLIDFSLENQSFERMLRNPQLFLEASPEELVSLAENPQVLEYAQLLTASLEEMTYVSVSEEELAYIRSYNQNMRQTRQSSRLRQSVTY